MSKTGPSDEVINQVDQVAAARLVLDTTIGTDSETQPASGAVPPDNASASRHVERFVAAFRGRQMYGQAVDIPNEYGGLVLRAPFDPKGKGKEDAMASSKPLSQKTKPKSKTRVTTRRLKCPTVVDAADEPEGGEDEDCRPYSDMDPLPVTRKLMPCSTFASFMLWTPDIPLDEGRDEYARALVEWTRLAAEVSSCECLFYILDLLTLRSRRYIRMMNESMDGRKTSAV